MLDLAMYSASDGVLLNALFWTPEMPGRTVAILTPGGFGGFCGPHDFRPTARELNRHGIALMFVNMRTAYGFVDPDLHDCETDIAAAVDEAARRGYDDVILMGCSLGGPRTLLYAAAHSGARHVRGVVLINAIPSPYEESLERNTPDDRARLDGALAEAREWVNRGDGERVYEFRNWFKDGRGVRMTARGFLNVYGSPADTDISALRNAPAVTAPVLIIHGTEDHISLPRNAETLRSAFTASDQVEIVWVEGGTHYWGPGDQAEMFGLLIGDEVARRFPPRSRSVSAIEVQPGEKTVTASPRG